MIPVCAALAPVVEPAHHLVQVVDPRPRDGNVGHGVVPRADQHLLRHRQLLIQAQGRVRIAVAPSADQEHRAADPVGHAADRAVPPVRPVGLMREPLQVVGLVVGDVVLPDPRPVPTRPLRIGRQRVVGGHEIAVVADVVVLAQMAAPEVTIVCVAVVREVHRDDARQVRRRVRSDLKRREAAVGDAHLVDVPVAEGLRGEPLDRVIAVLLLLQHVLVGARALGGAGATDVDTGNDVAVSREILVEALSPDDLVLAIGDVLHHHGQRLGMARSRLGPVQIGGEADAVAHRDEDVLRDLDTVCPSHRSASRILGWR